VVKSAKLQETKELLAAALQTLFCQRSAYSANRNSQTFLEICQVVKTLSVRTNRNEGSTFTHLSSSRFVEPGPCSSGWAFTLPFSSLLGSFTTTVLFDADFLQRASSRLFGQLEA
jgi:hypothetical protein